MTRIKWDQEGTRLYETGTRNGVLYVKNENATTGSNGITTNAYLAGVPWNGLTGVSESPSGAEETKLFADDQKYLSLYSAEEFACTIEAYTFPDEFAECDGSAQIVANSGIFAGQQVRKSFGFAYRTVLGNDVAGENYGYKLHIVYNATASPSEKSYATINDSPEAISFSWSITTTPVFVAEGLKNTATLILDSTKVPAKFLTYLENILYGSADAEPRLPLPNEIIALFNDTETWDPTEYTYTAVEDTTGKNPATEGWYVGDATNGYTLTEDTEPQSGTTYYVRSVAS